MTTEISDSARSKLDQAAEWLNSRFKSTTDVTREDVAEIYDVTRENVAELYLASYLSKHPVFPESRRDGEH